MGDLPLYTYAGTLRELKSLGVDLKSGNRKPHVIKLLVKEDLPMLHRIMTLIRNADAPTREVWAVGLGDLVQSNIMRTPDQAPLVLKQVHLDLERMCVTNSLIGELFEALEHDSANDAYYQARGVATYIENMTYPRVSPTNPDYDEVKAAIVYYAITRPVQTVGIAWDAYNFHIDHRDDIVFIAENMDEVLTLVSKLHQRSDASRHTITMLLEYGDSALVDGAL